MHMYALALSSTPFCNLLALGKCMGSIPYGEGLQVLCSSSSVKTKSTAKGKRRGLSPPWGGRVGPKLLSTGKCMRGHALALSSTPFCNLLALGKCMGSIPYGEGLQVLCSSSSVKTKSTAKGKRRGLSPPLFVRAVTSGTSLYSIG